LFSRKLNELLELMGENNEQNWDVR
jgi:hypothetical protein